MCSLLGGFQLFMSATPRPHHVMAPPLGHAAKQGPGPAPPQPRSAAAMTEEPEFMGVIRKGKRLAVEEGQGRRPPTSKKARTVRVPRSYWPSVPGEACDARSDVASSRAEEHLHGNPPTSVPEAKETTDTESMQSVVSVPSSKVISVLVTGGQVKKMVPRPRRREPDSVDLVEVGNARRDVGAPQVPSKDIVGEKGVCDVNISFVLVSPVIRQLVRDLQSLQPPAEV
ncbi:PREDICTED: uncharacterized protein LOC104598363 isoform X2 [Nelumbo nucifera]|uniref:Uncharacterized protein LOC104598363 isoform X2 n=1 Tax=Nelumbo nucifera TaxID=4432 RepID=A0A1U7ZW59_NELNU|nr:PREDICTED: uncharacterized protein LOC104598363 isoform X2 [Nelumbo nucifera]